MTVVLGCAKTVPVHVQYDRGSCTWLCKRGSSSTRITAVLVLGCANDHGSCTWLCKWIVQHYKTTSNIIHNEVQRSQQITMFTTEYNVHNGVQGAWKSHPSTTICGTSKYNSRTWLWMMTAVLAYDRGSRTWLCKGGSCTVRVWPRFSYLAVQTPVHEKQQTTTTFSLCDNKRQRSQRSTTFLISKEHSYQLGGLS